MSAQEKRRHKRETARMPTWLADESGLFAAGDTVNISPEGAFILVAISDGKGVEVGRVVEVKLACTDESSSLICQMVGGKSQIVRLENRDGKTGIALKFVEKLTPKEQT